MKFLAVVFMFAFVAVQFSRSAPTPDEEKKEDVVPAAAHPPPESAQPVAEGKSSADSTPAPLDATTAEQKKDH